MPSSQNDNNFKKERQDYLDNFKHHQKGKILVRIARFMGLRQFLKFVLFFGLAFIFLSIALIVQLGSDFDGYLTNLNTDEKNVYSLEFYNPKTLPTPLKTPLKVNTAPNKIAMNEEHIAIVDGNGKVRFWGHGCFLDLCSDKHNPNLIKTGKIVENLDNIIGIEMGGDYERNYLALKSDGTVWAMGNNKHGIINPFLYHNRHQYKETKRFNPEAQEAFAPIDGLAGIVDMAFAYNNSFFLNTQGQIFVLGEDKTKVDERCFEKDQHILKKPTSLTGLEDIEKLNIVNIVSDSSLLAISRDGKLYKINTPNQTKDGRERSKPYFDKVDCPLDLVYSIEEINLKTHKKVVDVSTNRSDFAYPYSILFDDGSLLFYGKKDKKTGEILSKNLNENSKNFAPIIKLANHSAYTANNELIVWDDYSMSGCQSSEYCMHRIGKDFGSPHLLADNVQLREFRTSNNHSTNWGAMIDTKGDVWIWGYDHRDWIGGLDKKTQQGYKANPKKQLITLRNTGVNIDN